MGQLTVTNADKRYGSLHALDSVSLEVHEGEFVSIVGPSGCGKTTLLRSLAGLVRLDGGRVLLDGRDITRLPTHQRAIGFVFQNYALFPHMSVERTSPSGCGARQSGAEVERAVAQALDTVRLPQARDRMPAELSGGQQQRIALARALVTKPGLLLLDEPFSALDRQLREQMQLELRDLTRRLKITAIFVTHDQGEALIMSDRIAVMNAGRIDQIGAPGDIYERPRTKFVLDFVGLSNFMPGRVVGRAGDACEVDVGGRRYHAAAPGDAAQGEVGYAVRPEKISLLPPEAPASHNHIAGVIRDVAYLGDITHYHVDVGEERPFLAHVVNRSGSFSPAVDRPSLQWLPADAVVIPGAAQ
jgi:ABC-type Fe3+/spermidine/putrescine transport system ATPase subunit